MATAKQKRAQSRMRKAAKACKGRKGGSFRTCMKRNLRGAGGGGRRRRRR